MICSKKYKLQENNQQLTKTKGGKNQKQNQSKQMQIFPIKNDDNYIIIFEQLSFSFDVLIGQQVLIIQLFGKMMQKSPVHRHKLKNISEFQGPYNEFRQREQSRHHVRSISIKINRNKLPADFFPRTQSLRKSKGNMIDKNRKVQIIRRAQSDRNHYSPEKTSFFGFMEDNPIKKSNPSMSLKRKFQSREEPKRDRIVPESRHFTPISGTQRSDLLYLYSDRPDVELTQTLLSLNKMKGLQISPRKQHISKYREAQQQMAQIDPEKQIQPKKQSKIAAEPVHQYIKQEEMHNITFFNAKSTSFPPINRTKNSN